MKRPRRGGNKDPQDTRETIEEAIAGLKHFREESAIYNQSDVLRAHTHLALLADRSTAEDLMTPLEAIEVKIAATQDVHELASTRGDEVLATSMAHNLSVLETLQTVLTAADKATPAETTTRNTGSAKSRI